MEEGVGCTLAIVLSTLIIENKRLSSMSINWRQDDTDLTGYFYSSLTDKGPYNLVNFIYITELTCKVERPNVHLCRSIPPPCKQFMYLLLIHLHQTDDSCKCFRLVTWGEGKLSVITRYIYTAVASMRRTEALASVKFYKILSIFFFYQTDNIRRFHTADFVQRTVCSPRL